MWKAKIGHLTEINTTSLKESFRFVHYGRECYNFDFFPKITHDRFIVTHFDVAYKYWRVVVT